MLLIKTPEWLFNANKLLKHLATIYIYTFFYQLFQIGSKLVDYYKHKTEYVDYQHLTECQA
jgi:hypothetical protein